MLRYSIFLLLALPFASADNPCIKYACSACACMEWENPSPTATTTSGPPTPTGPVNLITNGEFEIDWTYEPWVYVQGTGGARRWFNEDYDPSNSPFLYQAHSGHGLLLISSFTDWTGLNVVATSMSQPVNVIGGTSYTFKAYYVTLWIPLTSTVCYMKALIDGVVKKEVSVDHSKVGDYTVFELLTFDYTPPDTGVNTVTLSLNCDGATFDDGGTMGWDDISLTETVTAL